MNQIEPLYAVIGGKKIPEQGNLAGIVYVRKELSELDLHSIKNGFKRIEQISKEIFGIKLNNNLRKLNYSEERINKIYDIWENQIERGNFGGLYKVMFDKQLESYEEYSEYSKKYEFNIFTSIPKNWEELSLYENPILGEQDKYYVDKGEILEDKVKSRLNNLIKDALWWSKIPGFERKRISGKDIYALDI